MEDASFRHQLLSDLKHFLYHVLESRAKLQNDLHVSNYQVSGSSHVRPSFHGSINGPDISQLHYSLIVKVV